MKFGKDISQNLNYCPTRQINEEQTEKELNKELSRAQKNNKYAVTSFLSAIAMLVCFYINILIKAKLFLLAPLSPGAPEEYLEYLRSLANFASLLGLIIWGVTFVSIVTGCIGIHSKSRPFAIIGLSISATFILFQIVMIFL